jgi:hypothetical protein
VKARLAKRGVHLLFSGKSKRLNVLPIYVCQCN